MSEYISLKKKQKKKKEIKGEEDVRIFFLFSHTKINQVFIIVYCL